MVSTTPVASRVTAAQLETFIAAAFVGVGISSADASAIAQLMARADVNGSEGHGVFRLPQYIRRIKGGAVNVKPHIRIEREAAGMALVNGDNGMGHLVMRFATETAIAKARTAGVAWVGAQWSNHAGPASLYASMPVEHNMIGLYLAVGNANHLPAWGGLDMLLSTNPIAIAMPGESEAPVILDMATTVAAYGKVKTKAQRGEMMPEGWMMDRQGKPLTDRTGVGAIFAIVMVICSMTDIATALRLSVSRVSRIVGNWNWKQKARLDPEPPRDMSFRILRATTDFGHNDAWAS